MQLHIETTERTALDAARAEGRAEGADALHQLVSRWLTTFADLVGGELGTPGGERFGQFASALLETLASKVEDYRREQSRAIDRYVEHRRAVAQ
jgi:hypothetical protein